MSQRNSSAGLSRNNYIPSGIFPASTFKHPIPMGTGSEEGYQMEEPAEAHQCRDHSKDLEVVERFSKTAAPNSLEPSFDFGLEDDWMETMQNDDSPGDSPVNHTDCKPMKDIENSSPASTRPSEPIRLQPQVVLQGTQIAYAKSQATGFEPPLPPRNERLVVQDLLAHVGLNDASGSRNQKINPPTEGSNLTSSYGEQELEFTEIELTGFTVYLPGNRSHPFEMRGLNHLATRMAHSNLVSIAFFQSRNLYPKILV